jgi:hypothetical protein
VVMREMSNFVSMCGTSSTRWSWLAGPFTDVRTAAVEGSIVMVQHKSSALGNILFHQPWCYAVFGQVHGDRAAGNLRLSGGSPQCQAERVQRKLELPGRPGY